jgi:DNA-binding winged helix-turn-helix (wHTH) protein/predicted ATPase
VPERRIHFHPFALDLVNECLWKGPEVIRLRPKAFAVLEHLASRPGELVTKEHLLGAVWQDTFVGDAVLKVAIRQIREALSDSPRTPRFIETAHRRGYRFIASIGTDLAPTGRHPEDVSVATVSASPVVQTEMAQGFVGREQALARLHAWFEQVQQGEPKIVFVTGEAGIGKTTLLDRFTRAVGRDPAVRVCAGQCLEQYGMSEAYLPVLDAMRELAREDPQLVDHLRAHAPMWLMEMPSLVTPADRESFRREAAGATRERMLREMGEALDILTERTPLLLILEDLHWSDLSTLDLIAYIARRRRAAHLMIVGTYRPAELIPSGHPLRTVKQELVARQLCDELPLEYLTEPAVAEHLDARFPAHQFPRELAALIHERTDGNPLFMVNTIDHLIAERLIEPSADGWRMTVALDAIKPGVPDSIRQLIDAQIGRLDVRDQRILEAASAAGAAFQVPVVAAALDEPAEDVDGRCEAMSGRHQFIRECGVQVLPNGEVAGRYGFVHAVYRHVLYERVSASRRVQLHRRIAERVEAVYGDRAQELAAELAMHFERGADTLRAAAYLQQAAVNATHRSAYREAIALSRRGLELLGALPDEDERARLELRLQITLGVPLIATEGYAASAVGDVYTRARRLCERLRMPVEASQVVWGLWTFHALKADLSTALDRATELLELGRRGERQCVAMRGHWAMEVTCMHRGHFAEALEHFERARALFEADGDRDTGFADALNPMVAMHAFAGWVLWFTGHPDRALVPIQHALTIARPGREPHSAAHVLAFAAVLDQLRRDRPSALRHADETIALSELHGLVLYESMGRIIRGWALVGGGRHAEAVSEIERGLGGWCSTGAQLMRPHFLALLAEAHGADSSHDTALRILDEAITEANETGEHCYAAELHRLKGERLAARDGAGDRAAADAAFEEALSIATRQDARSLQLRIATSLARLHRVADGSARARHRLTDVFGRFQEGFETADLQDAQQLLQHPPRA